MAERGDAHERAGLYDRAAEDYGRLIAIEPGNAKAWNNRCWDRAILGRLEEALADCNEALRLAPDDPGTLDSRGFTYLKLGRFEQAIADYDAALARNPRDPGSLYGRGLARLRSKMILKAAAPISRRRKRSTRVSPRNLLATDLASDALSVCGRTSSFASFALGSPSGSDRRAQR